MHFYYFLSSFTIVFLLGFQSQIVRDRHAFFAFFISLGVGICQVASMKIIPTASFIESIFFILGGACGISSSIYAHGWWKDWYHNRKNQKAIDAFQPMIDAEKTIHQLRRAPEITRGHPQYIASIDD